MNRHETIFSLRYAVRVHERRARFWGNLDLLIRVISLLSGSAAIAAIAVQSQKISIAFGVVFALLQAIEYGISPAIKSAESISNRKIYSSLLSKKSQHDDDQLEQAYAAACENDEVLVGDSLKEIAYNDVAQESGADLTHAFQLGWIQRLIKWLS